MTVKFLNVKKSLMLFVLLLTSIVSTAPFANQYTPECSMTIFWWVLPVTVLHFLLAGWYFRRIATRDRWLAVGLAAITFLFLIKSILAY